MRLVTYKYSPAIGSELVPEERAGFLLDVGAETLVLDAERAYAAAKGNVHGTVESLPSTTLEFLRRNEATNNEFHRQAQKVCSYFASNHHMATPDNTAFALNDVELLSPLPHPVSMRDGYAFRQHVETARRNRGLPMIDVFDQIPIFYFTNHLSVTGGGDVVVEELHLDQLDFELEIAVVIGKSGKNIPAARADDHIYGFTVMNDWSARTLQMLEMQMNLGPAKGKDFATSLGPCLVSTDALKSRTISTPAGNHYDLPMQARLNGERISSGNVKDMHWTFAQIIERASYGVELHAGEVIGSGTCGTGCLLELNGSKVFEPARWLTVGDVVECEIEGIGTLSNTIRRR
jgi:fumarylacetoacetate (FAA) hydrolase